MSPCTYDQIELVLILLCGPVSFLFHRISAETPEWLVTPLVVITMPLQLFVAWSVSVRAIHREFFFWYLGLWP